MRGFEIWGMHAGLVAAALTVAACAGDDGDGSGEMVASQGMDTQTSDTPGSTGDDGTSAGETMPEETTGEPATTGEPGSTGEPQGSTGAEAVCMTDVCATYGPAVPAVVSQIVDEAATDPLFMEDFAPLVAAGDDAVMAFKDSLTNFITDAYGCTQGVYTGPSMEDAHAGLGITQEEYDAFIGLIAGVLADNGVPEEDINLCFAPPLLDPGFVSTIVGL